MFNVCMKLVNKNYRECVYAPCSCWETAAVEVQEALEEKRGVHVASQALSLCLLQPSTSLPDAVGGALRAAGGFGDCVASKLSACMSRRRWFVRWQNVELLCRSALGGTSSELALSTTTVKSAKMERRSEIKCGSGGQPSLHKPGCPYVASGTDSSRKAWGDMAAQRLRKRKGEAAATKIGEEKVGMGSSKMVGSSKMARFCGA